MHMHGWFHSVAVVIVILVACSEVGAAPLSFVPQTVRQPDGTTLHCFACGDEFHN